MIGLGKESLDRFASSQRDIRGVTIGMSAEAYQILKQRMESLWKELLAFGAQQDQAEIVYQINMQLFPLSDPQGDEE